MNQLAYIHEILSANKNITVERLAPVYDLLHSRNYTISDFFRYRVDFWVAPKGNRYTIEALQKFLEDLVPGLKPVRSDDFRSGQDGGMEFGWRFFAEEIGTEIVEIAAFYDTGEGQPAFGSFRRRYLVKHPIKILRGMMVRLFPSTSFLEEALYQDGSAVRVSKDKLVKYRRDALCLASPTIRPVP